MNSETNTAQPNLGALLSPLGDKRLTDDGFEVPSRFKLAFTPLCGIFVGWSGILLSIQLEWNSDRGCRRPYLVIDIGPFHLQSGWLWYLPDDAILSDLA